MAFEYRTINDLLAAYARLKELRIEPVLTADHGVSTALYYEDPDRNSIEVTVDNFGDEERSSEQMRASPEVAAKPMGTYVDAGKMIAARRSGASVEELHLRAYAGEFPPSKPMSLIALM